MILIRFISLINDNYSDYYGLMIKMQPKLLIDAMNGMGLIACKR
jgi:hypothetical protein